MKRKAGAASSTSLRRTRWSPRLQVGLRRRQARHAGLTKSVALEVAEHGITVNAICPGYVLTPLVEKQIPDTAKARGISEEAVVRDVLLAAQPTKQFVRSGGRRARRVPVHRRAALDHRHGDVGRRRLDRAVRRHRMRKEAVLALYLDAGQKAQPGLSEISAFMRVCDALWKAGIFSGQEPTRVSLTLDRGYTLKPQSVAPAVHPLTSISPAITRSSSVACLKAAS